MVAAFRSSNLSSAATEDKHGIKLMKPPLEEHDEDEFRIGKAPLKYMPLCDVYSSTSPCITASGSKKVNASARKPPQQQMDGHDQSKQQLKVVIKPAVTRVYSRQKKRKEITSSFYEELIFGGLGKLEVEGGGGGGESGVKRRRTVGSGTELIKLGVDCKALNKLDVCDSFDEINCQSVVKDRNLDSNDINGKSRKQKNDYGVCSGSDSKKMGAVRTKKWDWLSFEGIDPNKFIGLQCKVYWPLDSSWYSGRILGYNFETGRHHVKYEDEEEENLILANERIKFHVSHEETQSLKLKCRGKSSEADGIDVNEMMVLAASLNDCQEIEPEDIIWAKLTGKY